MKKIILILFTLLYSFNLQAEIKRNNTKIEINIEKNVIYSHTSDVNINYLAENDNLVMVSNDFKDFKVLSSFFANPDGTLNLRQYIVSKNNPELFNKYDFITVSNDDVWFETQSLELSNENIVYNDDYIFILFNQVQNIESKIKNIVYIEVSEEKAIIKNSKIVVSGKYKINQKEKSIINYNGKFQAFGDVLWSKSSIYSDEEALVANADFDFVSIDHIKDETGMNIHIKRLPNIKGDIVILPYVEMNGSSGYAKSLLLKSDSKDLLIEF